MTNSATPHDPRKLPRQARSRALVDAILDAAARILADRGRESLTTNAVAIRAGVSIGSLYQYFPNRDAIIAAVANRHEHRTYHHVADLPLGDHPTLEEAIAGIVAGLFAAHRLDPALHAALDGHDAHAPEQADHHRHGGTKQAVAERLLRLPEAARRDIRRPDHALATAIVAELVHALAHAAILHPHDDCNSAAIEHEATVAALAYLRAS